MVHLKEIRWWQVGRVSKQFSCIGFGLLLATSAVAFSVVKWVGARFLIYLGLRMLFAARKGNELMTLAQQVNLSEFRPTFLQGILVEALNPKTAIFSLAFIPQFIRPAEGNVFLQFLLLGMTVVFINSIPDCLIA